MFKTKKLLKKTKEIEEIDSFLGVFVSVRPFIQVKREMSLIADNNIELVQCGVYVYACASFCPFLFIFGIKFQKINASKLQKNHTDHIQR